MHKRLETWFAKFGGLIADNPIKMILFALLVIAFPLSQVPKITMDTSTEGFMHKSDPMLVNYNKFKDQFGRDERIMIAVKSEDVFTLRFLEKLEKLHKELEDNLPYLDEVTSLVNVRNTRGEGDVLHVEDLLEQFPTNDAEVLKIKEIVMASEFYKNLFISEDGKITTLVIETQAYSTGAEQNVDDMFNDFEESSSLEVPKVTLSDAQNSEVVAKTKEIVAKYQTADFDIYYAGSPAVMDELKGMMKTDMQKFTRLTIAIVLVFLFLIFRRLSATFYPLIIIILALLATVGSMGFWGVAFKLPTQIVPSLLIAVSVGATVHILSVFFDKFNKVGDKKEALVYTMGHSGLAIAMTAVTTAIGIASFSGSEVAPISDMGKFASLGVLISLFLTLTLLPALLMVTKLKAKPQKKSNWLDIMMKKLAFIPTQYPKLITTISMLLVFISLALATQLKLSHHPLEWFPKENMSYVSTNLIDKEMKGTLTMELVIDTKEENGWHSPERLQKLDKISTELEGYADDKTFVGKIFSLNTIVKEINRALHANEQEYYVIPSDKALVSQELLLFENSGSDDLEDIVDSQFSKVRVTHKLPWRDSMDSLAMIDTIKAKYKEAFVEEEITVTGMIPILVHTFSQSIQSSVESYLIAFVLIAIMMMFIMGSMRLGLIAMIPNLTPIIIGLSLMYIYSIPLDMFTLLIGSIAIGLAVDDTIHFLHNFRRYYLESGDAVSAVENTFFTTGKAMVITTIVLSLGFFSYMFGEMQSVQNFGFLTGSVIILALLADLFLAPALMVLIAKKGWIK